MPAPASTERSASAASSSGWIRIADRNESAANSVPPAIITREASNTPSDPVSSVTPKPPTSAATGITPQVKTR